MQATAAANNYILCTICPAQSGSILGKLGNSNQESFLIIFKNLSILATPSSRWAKIGHCKLNLHPKHHTCKVQTCAVGKVQNFALSYSGILEENLCKILHLESATTLCIEYSIGRCSFLIFFVSNYITFDECDFFA